MLKKFLYKLRGEIILEDLLKLGLRVGCNFDIMPNCRIDRSHCHLISIGDNVTLAENVQILAHDASIKKFINYTKVGRVTLGNNVFVGANTTILPNVKIGDRVIIGAGSVVTKDIPSNSVAVGNPCIVISTIDDYLDKHKTCILNNRICNKKDKKYRWDILC